MQRALVLIVIGISMLGSSGCRALTEMLHPVAQRPVSPQAMITPLPWVELGRSTSPDGIVDAVLVTRKDSGPPLYLVGDPTNVFVLPHQAVVPRDPPYPITNNQVLIEKGRTRRPFQAYDAIEPRVSWQDDKVLLIGARKAEVHLREDSHEITTDEGVRRRISIRYFVEWDSMTEQSGSPFPSK